LKIKEKGGKKKKVRKKIGQNRGKKGKNEIK